MSSENIAIRVSNLSKYYHIYDRPQDRLKQSIIPRLKRLVGRQPKNYYHEFWALKDVSFEVKKGETVGIIGRNGSGKSTLLQIICGTLTPSNGIVETNGRIAALLELGSGFNPEFTGRENVYMNGAVLGLSKEEIDARFDDIAAFADIGDFIDQPVKTYSSGMLVRLAFSVQVQLDPDILIIDEALSVGDALFQKRCFQRIESFRANGGTLLFVSHDQEAVRTLTSKAILLHGGAVKAIGLSSEVVLEYRRQLHEEETAYFSAFTQKMMERSKPAQTSTSQDSNLQKQEKIESALSPVSGATAVTDTAMKRYSFGDGGVKVLQVETFNDLGAPCTIFYPGDRIRVKVQCISTIDIDKLNVAIRIRNKEGYKIYSWGTLNQDMQVITGLKDAPIFWHKQVHAGEILTVWLECDCALGVNLYEIQASVSYEERPDYTEQYILHWVDEAAFFQVLMKQDEYFFGGVIDLKMVAKW